MFSLTDRCMGKCVYCKISKRKSTELTLPEVCNIINEVSAMGCTRIGFWGGEPLIREDIEDILKHAKSKGVFVTLDTNGYLLEEKKEVLKYLDHLIISFDGPGKMHEANRGKGTFKKAIKALEFAAGKIPLWTITVVTKNNIEGIDYILKKAKETGFMASFQFLHHNDILGDYDLDIVPSKEECKDVVKKLIS